MNVLEKSILSKEERYQRVKNMCNNKKEFSGNFWIIGAGSIGSSIIFLLLKLFKITEKNIFVIDKNKDLKNKIKQYYGEMIKFINEDIVKSNYKTVLNSVKKNDIIIDCSYCINTCDMLEFCNYRGCSYINSSIEEWVDEDDDPDNPVKNCLMYKTLQIEEVGRKITNKNTNFIVSMGCNPGNVSIWIKLALRLLNNNQFKYENFGELAFKLGIEVVHISEKDTQLTKDPKKNNEYCNTWSGTAESMYEEATAAMEGSWGTHEKNVPKDIQFDPYQNNNYLVLKRRGFSTYANSYVPISKNFIGMLIRHDEVFTIGRELAYYQNNKLISKPSVYYVYHPTDSTIMSFYELKERNLEYQDHCRLLTNDIICGRDELGLSIFLNKGDIYWIGSLLSIEESREIFKLMGEQSNEIYNKKLDEIINATVLQVLAGYLSGIIYILELIQENKYLGLMVPDDLPYGKILKNSMPFLGEFIMKKIDDWDYKNKYEKLIENKELNTNNNKKLWQFDDFLVDI